MQGISANLTNGQIKDYFSTITSCLAPFKTASLHNSVNNTQNLSFLRVYSHRESPLVHLLWSGPNTMLFWHCPKDPHREGNSIDPNRTGVNTSLNNSFHSEVHRLEKLLLLGFWSPFVLEVAQNISESQSAAHLTATTSSNSQL